MKKKIVREVYKHPRVKLHQLWILGENLRSMLYSTCGNNTATSFQASYVTIHLLYRNTALSS